MAKEKNELKCGRLIDADALKENIRKNYVICTVGHYFDDLFQDFYNAIDEQPTIDAVPVIRCKDCKHYNATPINMGYCLGVWGLYVDENGYCYKAEP